MTTFTGQTSNGNKKVSLIGGGKTVVGIFFFNDPIAQSGEYLLPNWEVLGSNPTQPGTVSGLVIIIMWGAWPGWKIALD